MRVFMTSGTGYVGSAVAEELKREGHEVVAMGRSAESRKKLEEAGIHPVEGNLREPEKVGALAAQADATIHTAQDKEGDTGRIDEEAARAILESLEGSARPFVYTSGCWVYGDTGDAKVTEDSILSPLPMVAWRPPVEELVRSGADRGVNTVVLRPVVVYGGEGGLLGMLRKWALERETVPLVRNGEQRWSFVHRSDMGDCYVKALGAPAGSLYNVSAGTSPTLAEVGRAVSLSVGRSGRVEDWPMEDARSELGPLADALALDQPHIMSEKAQEELSWTPRQPPVLAHLMPSAEDGW